MTNNDRLRLSMAEVAGLIVGAVLALIAAALLSSCATVQTAIDEYRDWRASQTNAPATPTMPDAPAVLRPIGDGFQVWYGRVNAWASAGEAAIARDIAACRAAGVGGYMIEMAGWARKDAWTDKWLNETEAAYKHILGECRGNGLWLFVSIVNDNMGSGKYGDPGIPLSAVMPQARRLCDIVRENGAANVVVQPAAETQTDAGREFEAYCLKTLTGFPLVYNGGSRPEKVPSGYRWRAWHPFKTSDAVPRDALVVSDTGSIIQQLGEGLDGKAHPDALEAWARAVRKAGCPVAGYYAFKFAGHDAAGIAALGKASDKSPPATVQPTSETGDAVEFVALRWNAGGVNGSKATRHDGVEITALKVGADSMGYRWTRGGCEQLGSGSRTDASKTLACLFYRDAGGQWVGGKFDWISTSRTSRDFKNIAEGYNGWNAAAFNAATEFAFVIVSADGKRRSNVIAANRSGK